MDVYKKIDLNKEGCQETVVIQQENINNYKLEQHCIENNNKFDVLLNSFFNISL